MLYRISVLLLLASAPAYAQTTASAAHTRATIPGHISPSTDWANFLARHDLFVPIETDPAFYVPATGGPFYLHVFDGRLVQPGIGYADGKRDRDVTVNWNRMDSGVDWNVRLATPARYRVTLHYATSSAENTGTFEISFGDQKLAGRVRPTASQTTFVTHDVGEVTLDAGVLTVSARAREIVGGELMRLRRIELTPGGAR